MAFASLLKNPVFYDIFGLVVFSYFAILAIYHLTTNTPLTKINAIVILVIALAGLVVDGSMVLKTFIIKQKPLKRARA
mgnify:FL=1